MEKLKHGDIVRVWDNSDDSYLIRTYADGGKAYEIVGGVYGWDNIELAPSSEHAWLDMSVSFQVKGRDLSHLQTEPTPKPNPVNPVNPVNPTNAYAWMPNGIECRQVSQWFSGNLAQAIQYIWRVGRKDDPEQEIAKAIKFLEFELERVRYCKANNIPYEGTTICNTD